MQILLPQRGPRGHDDGQSTQTSKDSDARVSQGISGASEVNNSVRSAPGTESTVCLVSQLITHFTRECHGGIHIRDKVEETCLRKKLKTTVFSVLLSHRKDYETDIFVDKLTELEEVIWQTFVLRQHRRYDDANSLDKCLQSLRESGHLEAGSDVRNVMKFLVALKGCGGDVKKKVTLAEIQPRIVHVGKNEPCYLPSGPLQYGDTFLQSAEYRPHYMHYPSQLFELSSFVNEDKKDVSLSGIENMIRLSQAPPGTGISPLLMGDKSSESYGKALGVLLQSRTGEVSPDTVLSVPELPRNAQGYSCFGHLSYTIPKSSQIAAGSDEGYASSRSAHQTPEDDLGDVWESVLQGPPLTSRRTWQTLDHVPTTKEKLFLTESGPESSHNVWLLYQDLWSSLNHHIPVISITPTKQLCQDLLNLMIGVPSHSFTWSPESESFSVKEGLCHSGITPEHFRGSVMPYVECGTLVRRLEALCSPPKFDSQHVLKPESVFQAFTFAVSNVVQTHRGMVFALNEETHFSKLLQQVEPLAKKIRFVAHLCNITSDCKTGEITAGIVLDSKANKLSGTDVAQRTLVVGDGQEDMKGLNLLGRLLNQIIVTKERDCLLLLMYIFKNSCKPFFRYLEDWIYQGVCWDPGLEFMIDIDGGALLQRDRRYWTKGYTLRDQASVPKFLKDVLQEAFRCGKALNLLKICSPKHHLVEAGSTRHPSLHLCVSGEELDLTRRECEAHAAHMDDLLTQNQITARQKADKEKEERHRLMLISSKHHAEIISEIESKMKEVRLLETKRKQSQLKELKEEMLKAEERRLDDKRREEEEDSKIALEYEKLEAKKRKEEEKLRAELEAFYGKQTKETKHFETLAHWRVQRTLLSDARKQHILNYDWSPQQDEAKLPEPKEMEEKNANVEESKRIKDSVLKSIASPTNQSPESDFPNAQPVNPYRSISKHLLNISPDVDKQTINEGNIFGVFSSQTDRTPVKESPNQEYSSVSDLTASLMSTSSDFVETPYDESLPDFEVDPKKNINSDKIDAENQMYAYTKSSIESVLYDRPAVSSQGRTSDTTSSVNNKIEASANKKRVLWEEYGLTCDTREGARGLTKTTGQSQFVNDPLLNLELTAEVNRSRVVSEEDYGIKKTARETTTSQDDNANFSVVCNLSQMGGDDENGNKEESRISNDNINANTTSDTPALVTDTVTSSTAKKAGELEDPNANILAGADAFSLTRKMSNEDSHTSLKDSADVSSVIHTDMCISKDDKNGNAVIHNRNQLVSEFRERKAQAAAIKQKVLNEEYQPTMAKKNSINIIRSKPLSSSVAARNRQKVLEFEYGMSAVEETDNSENTERADWNGVYSRQLSGTSTSSYKSCPGYERQTSGSTAFTTPDEEIRPILIDQVGGEVLKERGRSVHGHASDAVIHKLLCKDEEPAIPPTTGPYNDMSPVEDLLSAVRNSVVSRAQPYEVENLKLMGCEPLMDITGTALTGKPRTRQQENKESLPIPATSELSCAPIYFLRSIRMHLATQSRLVNSSLLSEVLVKESLLEHFSAIRSLLLLHDAHFARALTLNLFSKVETTSSPAALLIPVELNNILNKSVSESSWSSSPLVENLTFAVTNIPPAFTHTTSVIDCLELRYRVRWPHTIILDDANLAAYSRVWCFRASLHHSLWAADDVFCHMSSLSRQDKEGQFLRSPQFHQVCLYRHEMHQFLLVIQSYVISQVHQISWSNFEKKLREKISSLDDLYELHSSLVHSIISRCFLTHNGAVVLKLIRDMFSLMLRFRTLFLSHPWQRNTQSGAAQHLAFNALKNTYQEFQKLAAFLYKLLVKVGLRIRMESSQQDLLNRLDFNGYYSSQS